MVSAVTVYFARPRLIRWLIVLMCILWACHYFCIWCFYVV